MSSSAMTARLEVATTISRIHAAEPGIAAMFVGGSVAHGWADEWSDLELVMIWEHLPTPDHLARLAERAGAERRQVYPEDGAIDEEWTFDGLKIDLLHRTQTSIEHHINSVVHGLSVDWSLQAEIAAIRDGIVLHGTSLLDAWRTATTYPDALVEAMVSHHLAFGPHSWLEMLAERDDSLVLYSLCVEVERRLFGILLGLNRTYPPAPDTKWLMRVAETFMVAPRQLAPRSRAVFHLAPRDGVAVLRDLIEDTITLVETHLPTIETDAVRHRLARKRLG
jgi:hypothetical protein